MILNRKGLSDVVTTVLIILLVVAAIAVLWNFVGPMINRAGSSINKQTICLTNQIQVLACTKKATIATVDLSLKGVYDDAVSAPESIAYSITATGAQSTGGTATGTLSAAGLAKMKTSGSLAKITVTSADVTATAGSYAIAGGDTAAIVEITPTFKLKNGDVIQCSAVQENCIST